MNEWDPRHPLSDSTLAEQLLATIQVTLRHVPCPECQCNVGAGQLHGASQVHPGDECHLGKLLQIAEQAGL
jgi:hypothetical protein